MNIDHFNGIDDLDINRGCELYTIATEKMWLIMRVSINTA